MFVKQLYDGETYHDLHIWTRKQQGQMVVYSGGNLASLYYRPPK